MAINSFRKVVYFDKETISNSLQREYGGRVSEVKSSNATKALEAKSDVDVSTSVHLSVPFLSRLMFLFAGSLSASYLREWNDVTTITSTDMSRFEDVKSKLVQFDNVFLRDVRNSLTSLRLATSFGRIARGVDGEVNLKELSSLFDRLEGYDVYDIGESRYVRFNQESYLSNYKRQDIAFASLDLYCVKVGSFEASKFDFPKQLQQMQSFLELNGFSANTLEEEFLQQDRNPLQTDYAGDQPDSPITLYDVVCAYIAGESI